MHIRFHSILYDVYFSDWPLNSLLFIVQLELVKGQTTTVWFKWKMTNSRNFSQVRTLRVGNRIWLVRFLYQVWTGIFGAKWCFSSRTNRHRQSFLICFTFCNGRAPLEVDSNQLTQDDVGNAYGSIAATVCSFVRFVCRVFTQNTMHRFHTKSRTHLCQHCMLYVSFKGESKRFCLLHGIHGMLYTKVLVICSIITVVWSAHYLCLHAKDINHQIYVTSTRFINGCLVYWKSVERKKRTDLHNDVTMNDKYSFARSLNGQFHL